MTNREILEGLSIEEQVLYIKNHLYGFCYYCSHEISTASNPCDSDWCEEGIANWLDSEAGDDERRWLTAYFEVDKNDK